LYRNVYAAEGLVGFEVRSQHFATSTANTMHKQPNTMEDQAAAVSSQFDTD